MDMRRNVMDVWKRFFGYTYLNVYVKSVDYLEALLKRMSNFLSVDDEL